MELTLANDHQNHGDDWIKTQGHCNGQSFVPSQGFRLLLLKKQLKTFLFKKAFNLLE